MPFVEPYRSQHRCGSRDLAGEHRGILMHHRALIVAAAVVAGVAYRSVIANYCSDEAVRIANLRDGRRPWVIDVLETNLAGGYRLQLAERMIHREFDPRMNAAVTRKAVIVDRRMKRLASIADVMRQIA